MSELTSTAARSTKARRRGRFTLVFVATSLTVALCAGLAHAADNRKETRLEIAPGGSLNIMNGDGSVTLHSAPGHQLLISYTTHSDKVEVDRNTTADKQRVELITHALSGQKPTADEARVDLDVTVPLGTAVSVSTIAAPVTADGLSGDISFSSETGQMAVSNIAKSHVHVRSMNAPITLRNVTGGHVDVESSGGAVHLVSVTGPRVTVGTTSGNIDYRGDCSGGGDYIMTTHSGAIDVTLPPTASVDLSARSRNGSVENDFPLQQKSHQSFIPQQGRSFAGTSNSGSSSVELQSFSGKIRVKKQ